MKPFPVFLAASAVVFAVACSPMSGGGDLFASGRDGRVYNAETGRYEWPDEDRPRSRRKVPPGAAATRATPAPAAPGDGRVYDLQKGRYEWSDSGTPQTSPFQQ